MPDSETQKAINETLRDVRQRLEDGLEEVRRQRGEGNEHPFRIERMAVFRHAIGIVSEFIRPVKETDDKRKRTAN